jgi:hypothetical protein
VGHGCGNGAPAARSFAHPLRRGLSSHLGEEPRDRVGAYRHVDRGEQFTYEPERAAFLTQLHNAVLVGHQLCVTARCWRRERADGFIETLRARSDVGGFAHDVKGRLRTGLKVLVSNKG